MRWPLTPSQKSVRMEEVSKLLGHESIRTTEKHYAKWIKGRQNLLDALVADAWRGAETREKASARRERGISRS